MVYPDLSNKRRIRALMLEFQVPCFVGGAVIMPMAEAGSWVEYRFKL